MTDQSNAELRKSITKLVTDMTVDKSLSEEFLVDALIDLFQAREQQAIPKFSDMPEGNADFMEGFRAACLQMEANLERYREGL